MFYVLTYGDEKENGIVAYRFIGWTRSEYAARIYNVAGKKSLPFYEHYVVFEYPDMPNCDFIEILEREWDYRIRDIEDESYVSVYESPFNDYISLSSREYRELILEPDVAYNQGRKHMYSAYEYMRELEPFIRDNDINRFIREMFARYCEIFRGCANDPMILSKRLSDVASFITIMYEDGLPFY